MEYIEIGRLGKPHGLKGEIKLTIEDKFWEDFLTLDVLFVALHGDKIPLFIESKRSGEPVIAKFEDLNTREELGPYAKKPILARRQDISLSDEEIAIDDTLEFGYLVGYQIIDKSNGAIGTLDIIEEFPHQEMALVEYNEKTVYIPLHEAFMERVDTETKTLYLDLPDGLLDL